MLALAGGVCTSAARYSAPRVPPPTHCVDPAGSFSGPLCSALLLLVSKTVSLPYTCVFRALRYVEHLERNLLKVASRRRRRRRCITGAVPARNYRFSGLHTCAPAV
ncbi:hypothetical protein PLICRDRAFT_260054 [Plicaturopsis crispa FD-325 SS-3]|nr:hypothetical protein PLICRDRAFT_260054 [Plicaturopsis crispa FD-325 SS-3]